MKLNRFVMGLCAMAMLATPAIAQTTFPTAAGGNVRVAGEVPLQCNSSGAACAPPTTSNPVPVSVITGGGTPTGTAGSPSTSVVTVQGIAGGTVVRVDGSAVTQPTSVADGSSITIGAQADAAWTSGAGSAIALLKAIDRDTLLPLAAGSNLVGKVGIDQTTPGTTNAVVPTGKTAAGSAASENPVGVGGKYIASTPTYSDGQRTELLTDNRGSLKVIIGTAGTYISALGTTQDALSSQPNMPVTSFGMVWNGTNWDRLYKPTTIARLLSSAATTNATLVKNSAGNVFKVTLRNTKASAVYLKLYNKATAPTCGTDTPVATEYLPTGASVTLDYVAGLYFATGIGFCITGAAADNDTTALASGDVVALNIYYQ